MKLRIVLIVVIMGSAYFSSQAQLRIDAVEPHRVERGRSVVLRGIFGDSERRKVIRLARVIDGRTDTFYPTIISWTRTEVEIRIPTTVPLDTFYVTVVYTDRPTRHSNNAILMVRKPAPNAVAAGSDRPVVVLPNHCEGRPPRRRGSVGQDTERNTGALDAPCESMRTIFEEANLRCDIGGAITIRGDFGTRRPDQHVALAIWNGQQLIVTDILQIISWSDDRIRIRVGDHVAVGAYRLLLLNRLSRSVVPGVFEKGSTDVALTVTN